MSVGGKENSLYTLFERTRQMISTLHIECLDVAIGLSNDRRRFFFSLSLSLSLFPSLLARSSTTRATETGTERERERLLMIRFPSSDDQTARLEQRRDDMSHRMFHCSRRDVHLTNERPRKDMNDDDDYEKDQRNEFVICHQLDRRREHGHRS